MKLRIKMTLLIAPLFVLLTPFALFAAGVQHLYDVLEPGGAGRLP